ncbi:uncharacterized protein B0H18DRAFT_521428 [Fomitopsis serialis]|uniref:uncharacterized protein n=1 Tax=Fomitopsis serialis TaxID=139415 RepID=UPI00200816A5|nr:uncharacterized protein B0H18DRAFT_521428 [Neoantrodia serialis]KAH9922168.1 hypothetical protein B0H18DRAFT_521428 [Neoantrodia serialis]
MRMKADSADDRPLDVRRPILMGQYVLKARDTLTGRSAQDSTPVARPGVWYSDVGYHRAVSRELAATRPNTSVVWSLVRAPSDKTVCKRGGVFSGRSDEEATRGDRWLVYGRDRAERLSITTARPGCMRALYALPLRYRRRPSVVTYLVSRTLLRYLITRTTLPPSSFLHPSHVRPNACSDSCQTHHRQLLRSHCSDDNDWIMQMAC